ncbi:DUF1654 domain-containing protein [Pseudomonas sp. Z4-7]|uniref:DUF1654 domain-containing protein n=1 Tax=Pseudomonas sp. Z4-7 TaxID=2817413 RepID=UPI003DA82D1C
MQQNAAVESQPKNSYELVGRRIQRLIASPAVQKTQAVIVSRRGDESSKAWHRVVQEIEETSGVRIERMEDGAVRIG